MKLVQLLLVGSVFLLPLGAQAQWQWLDKDNKKVFSDQAPPPDVPEKNILRRPGGPAKRLNYSAPPVAEDVAAAPAPLSQPPAAPKAAGVDKELEEKARKAEEAEKARQAAETQKIAQARKENCSRAREGKATMDSGIRVARLNAQGEREIIDDATRASEQKRLQAVIDSDCK